MKELAGGLTKHALVLALALLISVGGSFATPYDRFLAGQLAILIITSLGLSILIGTAGLLSLASAAFLGVGAYGILILLAKGWPILLAVPAVLLGAWLLGGLLGLVSLRLEGFYLAIVTLGFLAVFGVFINHGGDLTGGSLGLNAPIIDIVGVPVTADNVALVALFLAVIASASTHALMRSRMGGAMKLVKVDSQLAALTGIPTLWIKTSAFALSAVFAAVAGILQAFLLGSASPASYTVSTSIQNLTVVVVAGLAGSALGTVVAAILLFEVPYLIPALGNYSDYFYAFLLLTILATFPAGLGGLLDSGRRLYNRRRLA